MRKTDQPAQHERDAGRRYLEHDHAANHLTGAPAREANRHARAIDEEHPRARDIALTGTTRELGRLPAHLRRHQLESRRQAGLSDEDVQRIRHDYRTQPLEGRDQRERPLPERTSPSSSVSGDVLDALGTGASAVTDSGWGELFGELFLGGILLSIGYLLLTHDTAVSKLFEGATNVTRAIVSPVVDPLNPKGAVL
jgi:hypothetical protein